MWHDSCRHKENNGLIFFDNSIDMFLLHIPCYCNNCLRSDSLIWARNNSTSNIPLTLMPITRYFHTECAPTGRQNGRWQVLVVPFVITVTVSVAIVFGLMTISDDPLCICHKHVKLSVVMLVLTSATWPTDITVSVFTVTGNDKWNCWQEFYTSECYCDLGQPYVYCNTGWTVFKPIRRACFEGNRFRIQELAIFKNFYLGSPAL
jgi:hypothetical protein